MTAAIAAEQYDSPFIRVLTDRALLHHVTRCVSGWPLLVFEFQRDVVPKYTSGTATHRMYGFPKSIGLLSHVAIAEDNQRVLEAVYKLHKQPQFRRLQRMDFAQAMRCAAYYGRLEMLQWMVREFLKDPSSVWEPELMEMALRNKKPSIKLVEWLYEHSPPVCRKIHQGLLVKQATRGNLDVLSFFYARGYSARYAIDLTAGQGRVDVVRFLHGYDHGVTTVDAMNRAARAGSLDVVRFLHENRTEGCTILAMNGAAGNGHLDVVKFLHENRPEGCTQQAMNDAAANGHLHVVQYLHQQGKPCTQDAMDRAAVNGHIDVVRFLHFNRSEGCTKEAMDRAQRLHQLLENVLGSHPELGHLPSNQQYYALENLEDCSVSNGARERVFTSDAANRDLRDKFLQVTKFLHEHRTEGCTVDAMNDAAWRGHLEVVQFLHEYRTEGCTTDAMDYAAWRGHLEIVKFLHFNRSEGCTAVAMDYAAREGHLHVVRFLHEHRTEGCTVSAVDFAAGGGYLNIVKFLHDHRKEGCTTNAMNEAAKRGYLEIVRFLHEHRNEGCTTKAMEEAAKRGHLNVVRFLHEHRAEGCTPKAMDAAAKNGHLEVVRFLHLNRSEGCTVNAINDSARTGHLPVIKFLFEHRDECRAGAVKAVNMACSGGHLDVVRYLVDERGKTCSTQTIITLIQRCELELVTYLYGNQATRHRFSDLPTSSWDRIRDKLEFAYLQQPDAQSADLQLNKAVLGKQALLVRVICQYTTRGCLFEARKIALEQQPHTGIADILDAFLDPDVQSCSLVDHAPDGPRRCQKGVNRVI